MADNVVRLEKRRANKGGLILLIILIVALLGGGVYYYAKNPDFLKSIFGKEDPDTEVVVKKDEEGNVVIGDTDLKEVSFSTRPIYENDRYKLLLKSAELTSAGYNFTVRVESKKDSEYPLNVNCEEVMIDGYTTGMNFSFKVYGSGYNEATFLIKKILFAELEITSISKLRLVLHFTYDGAPENSHEYSPIDYIGDAPAVAKEKVDNSKRNIKIIDTKDDLTIGFYKLLNDKENYYIYFLANGSECSNNHTLYVKKLLINGELYNYDGSEIFVHSLGMKMFYLKIPKKVYSNIENFSISFFVITSRKSLGLDDAIYITTQSLIKF